MISGIFIIDLLIPLGVATGVLYVAAVLTSLRHRNSQLSLGTAGICSLLTIIAFFASPAGGELWKVVANRALALFAIWTTTLMGRHQVEKDHTIQTQDHRIQLFMESLPIACFSFDRQGIILSWNAAAEQIYGYSKEEAVGASSYDLIVTPETHAETQNVFTGIFQGKSFTNMVWHDRNKHHEQGWRAGSLFPVVDAEGSVAYGINFNMDITAQKTVEIELQQKNALLEAILNSSSDAIYAKSREGKYLIANRAAADTIGLHPRDIIGATDEQLFGPDNAQALTQTDETVIQNIESLNIEETLHLSGKQIIFSSTKSRLKDSAGDTLGLVGVSRDITEWKQAQNVLLLTDRVFMTSPDHISIVGRDYRYRRVNHAYEKAHKKSCQEILGTSVADLLGQEVFSQTVKPMLDRCFQGKDMHFESWFAFADGQDHYMSVSYLPLSKGGQEVEEIVVLGRDMTERKQMEDALQASEHQLRTVLDAIPIFVGVATVDGVVLDCNRTSLAASSLTRNDVMGKPFIDTYWLNFSPTVQEQVKNIIRRVAQGEVVQEDTRVRLAENHFITVDACYVPVQDAYGQVIQIVASGIDVTAKRLAEAALQCSEEQFRDLYESAPLAYFSATYDGTIIRVNQRACELLGYSQEEMIGKPVLTFYAPTTAGRDKALRLQQQAQTGIPIFDEELEMRRKDGRQIWISLTVRLMYDESGKLVERRGMAQDITHRKQIELELRASEHQFRTLIETAGSIIIGLTSDGWIVEWNREAERLFGKTREEVLDQNFFELFIQEHHQSHIRTNIKKVLAGEPTRDLQSHVLAQHGKHHEILWNVDRLLDENHRPYGVICIGRDITEWNRAQASLQKWATIFQHTQWGVAVSQADTDTFEFVNEAYARMHEYTIEEMRGMPILQVCAPESRAQLPQIFETIDRDGFLSWESVHIRKDGSTFPAFVTISAIKNHIGQVLYRVANVVDISDLKHAQQALIDSQQIYQDLVHTIDGIVWECDFPSYQVTFVSAYAENFLGFPLQQWKDDPHFLLDMVHPDDRQRVKEFCQQASLRKKNHAMEYRVLHANGTTYWIRDQITVVVKNDKPVKLRGVMMDITELKLAEAAIQDSQELALGTMNALGANICVIDDAGTILLVNERWEAFAKKNTGNLDQLSIGTNYLSSCRDNQDIAQGIRAILKGEKKEFSFEYAYHSSTEQRWFICRANSFTQRQVRRVVIAHVDITEKKQAEQRLCENELFTNSILENLPNMVFVKEAKNLRFVRINKTAETLLGYERQELIGKNDFDFFPETEAAFFTKNDRLALNNGKLIDISEEHIHTKDGQVRILHTKKLPIYDETGNPQFLLGISEDITDHKRIQQELYKTESTLKSFFDSAPMMMGVVEITANDIHHLSDNRATADFFGQSEGGTNGMWASQLGVPKGVMDTWLTHYHLSLQNERPISFEYIHPHPRNPRWVSATVVPVIVSHSSLPQCAYIAQDITERKAMEDQVRNYAEELEKIIATRTERIQELEQRRMQIDKLAALAQIAAGVAHEINNPLASISQSLVLLKRAIPTNHPHFRYMAKVEDCIERIATITKHLYQLYRPSSPTPTPIDICFCIHTAAEIMEERAKRRQVSIQCLPPPDPIITHCSQGELIQVLCNLIHNAIDASRPGCTITIDIEIEPETLLIFVRDQGEGIGSADSPHIFEPFFTTKQGQAEGGMGLGLSISHSLVESMGGTLDFTTKIGQGTTFRICLPVTTTQEGEPNEPTGNRIAR